MLPRPSAMHLVAHLVCTLFAAGAAAQSCLRPRPPAPGFAVQLQPTETVVYSDGYVTEGNLQLPATTPPSCGWPLVVFVHRLGASRVDDFALQQQVVGQGYAVWAYDVRGQGAARLRNTVHPSPGTTVWGPIERCDLAEQIAFVAGAPQWQGLVDATRLAIVGSSQGGVHAWNAAAWSGQAFTVPGRGTVNFPLVACAVANDYVAEPVLDWLRDGNLWSSWFLTLIADDTVPNFELDQGFRQTAAAAFRAQDPALLLQTWTQEGRRIDHLLPASTVPVLYSHAYHDVIDSPLPTLRLLQGMTAPARALLSTIGHNTPDNLHELAHRNALILRWLHRWLWGEQDEVELEAPFILSSVPLDAATRADVNHPWSRRHAGDPLVDPAPLRLWLYDDGSMQDVEPSGPLPPSVIQQTVDPLATTFNPTDFLATELNRRPSAVEAACPLQERVFQYVLAEERQLEAAVALHLQITPDRPEWMIAALLTVQPPGQGAAEVMLSSWGVASTASAIGVPQPVDFVLPPVAAVLPAGATVRIRLRNLWLREYPMAQALEVAPRFHDFRIEVQHGANGTGSWVDLPLHRVTPALVSTTTWFDLATAAPVPLLVRGGVQRAGEPYFVTASLGGHVPQTPLFGSFLPIENDWMQGMVTASVLLPEFIGFLGVLDGNGEATAVMNLSAYAPIDPVFAGLRLSFAAWIFEDLITLRGAATNPLDVFLR